MRPTPLSTVPPDSLNRVLDEESECWEQQLFWDYRPALATLRKHIASGSLAGYVLLNTGEEAVGYSYYVVDPPMGYVGNLFVSSSHASRRAYEQLACPTICALRAAEGVQRIESQVFPFNFELAPLFQDEGFVALKRHFMIRSLGPLDTLSDTSDPAAFRVVNWHQQYLLPAAGVVWDSYRSSPDIDLCRDYQSREGCLRFLRNLTDNPGCGRFMPEISAVALDRRGGVCAVLIASAIGPSTGMIPQVSVRRDCQRQGLGARLLQLHFRRAAEHGLDRVALSVSSRNQGAHRLYLRLGFQVRKDFHAFIWNAC